MPKNRRANATLFGFGFQRNAAIVADVDWKTQWFAEN